MRNYPLPVLGFSAFSGTGKTTLITRVLPLIKEVGLRVAVIKQAHPKFDIDCKKKDSYLIRKAGADQMLIASSRRRVVITEFPQGQPEPNLEDALIELDTANLDLVLVEGYKRDSFPKIELHRPSMNQPLRFIEDPDIIAIACDQPLAATPSYLPLLDLNQIEKIAAFILDFACRGKGEEKHNPISSSAF